MEKIVENHTHKSGLYHEKGTLNNGTTPYHGQVKVVAHHLKHFKGIE